MTSLVIFFGLTLGTGQLLHLMLDRTNGSRFGDAWATARIYGGTTAFDLLRESIAVFSSGEAEQVLEQVVSGVTAVFAPRLAAPVAPPPVPPSLFDISRIFAFLRGTTLVPPVQVAPTLFATLKDRFLLGLGALGSLGAVGSLIGTTAMPLVSMLNTLRIPIPFLGGGGFNRRRGANGARQGPGIGAVLIVTVVVFGGFKCVLMLNPS